MENCNSYCEHGGVCTLELGHDGLHDSTYCQWSDAQALTRDAADAVLSTNPEGQFVKTLWDMLIPRDTKELE